MDSFGKAPIKLTIIVPVYKTEPFLRKCIDSILQQTFINFELILIDDGSPDNSSAICDSYAKSDNRVKVVHKDNEGVGLARKLGVSLANGEYIGFADSDDWLEPEMYELLITTAEQTKCDMVICDWTYHYLETNTLTTYTQAKSLKEDYIYNRREIQELLLSQVLLEELHCSPCNKLYKTNALKACNLERTVGLSNMQDWVLNCEYFKTVQRIIYIKKLLYHYSVHSGGSLRGSHKNYLATILRLHQLRMNYLAEFFEATREDLRRKCVIRFMNMALYATFEYEFLFKETTVKDKLERIAAVIENPEIRSNINETVMAGLNLTLLCKVQWRLFRLRMPVIIYGFARGLAFARNIKIMCGSLYKSLVKRRFMLAT